MSIPNELIDLKQWVLASSIKKIPFGKNLQVAKINDSDTFLSYKEALGYLHNNDKGLNCIGFVFTQQDPYCVIDLDNAIPDPSEVQQQILDSCKYTYIETSISGTGYHIIMKGNCPGRRKENVELYSYSRYVIFTGDTINGNPIINGQNIINDIILSMNIQDNSFIDLDLVDSLPDVADGVIIDRCKATYGTKFEALYNGDWKLHYRSNSEADIMLISLLCQQSSSNSQVARLFKLSNLGKRNKANRVDYLHRTINKARQNILWNRINKDTSIEQLRNYVNQFIDKKESRINELPEMPQGIIKDLTNYILNISVRPVFDISFVAALGLFAGICGRAFNISSSGLNLYLLLLAPTGSGKEQISYGIDKVVSQLRLKIPVIDGFIGPKGFSSGQALFRHINQQPSMVCVFGEFGYMLQLLSDKATSINGSMLMLRRAFLDLYQKSGQSSIVKPTAYADFKNDVPAVIAPNFTMIGEGTPETFYSELSETMISDGLLPRFMIIEYKGDRPARNKNKEELMLDPDLINAISNVVQKSITNLGSNIAIDVEIDEESQEMLDAFDEQCDMMINGSMEYVRQIWNRAHLKALKLAALFAVSYDCENPIVRKEHAEFAITFVENEIYSLLDKFETGELGEDNKYIHIIKEIIITYMQYPLSIKLKKNIAYNIAIQESIVSEAYLMQQMRSNRYIKKENVTPQLMKIMLLELVEQDVLVRIDIQEARTKFNYNGILYTVGRNFI